MPDEKIGRLAPIHRVEDLHPWRRAEEAARCLLYWIPVEAFPIPLEQRHWLMVFLDRLMELLAKRRLRPEVFLQFKSIYPDLMTPFQKHGMNLTPFLGLSRKPGATMPPFPSQEELDAIRDGHKKFNFDEYAADYCYWFVTKAETRQRELFFGHGGMTILWLPPDPKTTPPALPLTKDFFSKWGAPGLEGEIAGAFSLQDRFLKKSKELFGAGLEEEPQYDGLVFILPLLAAQDFLELPEEVVGKWFQLFDVYMQESRKDQGILLASRLDLEEDLIALLKQMTEDGLEYPEA